MLAKMTSKNQITLPKSVTTQLASSEYFDVQIDAGRIVLTPVRLQKTDAVREKLAQLGINESDIADAVVWARGKK
ncbi:MAG: AbrB/MazE/SpoVT family DNA-binding domain-containing protein [Gallionella sp.]|nr:MAG: AbrB/MazE/SpoVT family DNA-binding domain-containing protein [Gallionella sp.]